ncbi:hypothetical protein [Pontibacter mangrovi]|uniref:Uncharacterized protein n=1 Tax=Pontibacter mangrovi TaxID=2589816 RepID=A0A501W2V0_9BACT|nr:hypothetical protein [Pontibacter mangrovi]TPE42610.1 hypothetical protein FJM65_17510 [Pontibacter mangrovi]
MLYSLILALNLLLMSEAPLQRQVPVGQTFTISLHEQVQVVDSLSGSIATITLTELNDSRCPKDVLCVQAGEVTLQLEASMAGNAAPTAWRLTKPAMPSEATATTTQPSKLTLFAPAIAFGDKYKLFFLQALPYPEAEKQISANLVELRIERTENKS